MEIVIDAFGGDNAPSCVVDGCKIALKKHKNLNLVLCGDENKISDMLSGYEHMSRIKIIDAKEVILNEESPTEAIRKKKNSSICVALDYLKQNESCSCFISAGPTGAVLTGGFLKIGRLKGISRPALAPLLPTKTGGQVVLIDCGANVDCKTINLVHFAIMGSEYYKTMFGVDKPRVALLSNGAEDGKGNELVKEAFKELKKLDINFVGNMEARYFLSGDYDVVVCDGFAGNVLLKSVEGSIKLTMGLVKDALTSNLKSKIGALLCKKSLSKVKDKFDYHKHGGSLFVGCNKAIIKSHGSSKAETIAAAIDQAIKLEENNVCGKIKKAIEQNTSIEQV